MPPSFLPSKAAAYYYSATPVSGSGFQLPIAGRACKDLCWPVGSRRRQTARCRNLATREEAAGRSSSKTLREERTPRHAMQTHAAARRPLKEMNAGSCASSLRCVPFSLLRRTRIHSCLNGHIVVSAAVHPVQRSRLGPASVLTAQRSGLGWIVARRRILYYGGRKVKLVVLGINTSHNTKETISSRRPFCGCATWGTQPRRSL